MEKIHKKDDSLLFEINDYQYINIIIFEIIIFTIAIILLYVDYFDSALNKNIVRVLVVYVIVSVIFKASSFFLKKDKLIQFHENKITRLNSQIDISLSSSIEIYKLSSLWYIGYKSIKRPRAVGKLLAFIAACFVIPFLLLYNIMLSVYYKSFSIQKLLVVIGKNDKEVIVIPLPKKDNQTQEELFNYFQKYFNIDINQLETLWFIPKKG